MCVCAYVRKTEVRMIKCIGKKSEEIWQMDLIVKGNMSDHSEEILGNCLRSWFVKVQTCMSSKVFNK